MEREDYTWEKACKDIALSTRLTLMEANEICYLFSQELKMDPYDAVSFITRIVRQVQIDNVPIFATNLMRLIKLESKEL